MYETILVGTDGSDSAQNALEHAVELARVIGATLHVVTVVDEHTNPMKFGVTEVHELNQAKETLMDDIEKATGDDDLTADIRRGDAPDTLLEYAGEIEADLLIVGQSSASQLEAAVFGTTTERLAEKTEIPLTIVPLSDDD